MGGSHDHVRRRDSGAGRGELTGSVEQRARHVAAIGDHDRDLGPAIVQDDGAHMQGVVCALGEGLREPSNQPYRPLPRCDIGSKSAGADLPHGLTGEC